MDLAARGELCLELPSHAPAVVAVRMWVRGLVHNLPAQVLAQLVLICIELVANAYQHGCPPRRVRLSLSADQQVVRVEVDDASPTPPSLRKQMGDDTQGLGLLLVAALAQKWGVTPRMRGKSVWAEVATRL